MRTILSAIAALLLVPQFLFADPATAISRGRELIAKREYAKAVSVLRNALPEAAVLTRPSEQAGALSALHFYTAVALTELGVKDEAATELRSFFAYRPNATLDAKNYSKAFLELFDRVGRDVRREQAQRSGFQDHYPGFEFVDPKEPPVSATWGASSAFQLLASDDEKNAWAQARDESSQAAFVDEFWKKRDFDSSTPVNEFRADVLRRIAFADKIFGDEASDRGSLTDRGKVFVILGPPYRVVIRPLNQTEARFSPKRRGAGEGAVEEWVYRREQLPAKIPMHEVEFRFVSDTGTHLRTLQRTFHNMTAMGAVQEVLRGAK